MLSVGINLGFTEIVKLLLEHGADVNLKTDSGDTALDFAQTSGNLFCK